MQLQTASDTAVELVYSNNSPVQCLIKDRAKPFRPGQGETTKQLWVAQLNNEVSQQLCKGGAELALDIAKTALSEVFKVPVPELSHHYCHYWRFAHTASNASPMGLISDAKLGLAAGGDWSFGASIQASYQAACTLSTLIADKTNHC
jgi:renalase